LISLRVLEMMRARAIAVMSCLASTLASGTEYPSKPIRFVVPYAAGGSSDTVGRIVGQQLSERVGQQVVIDNRTGAGSRCAGI
jgi:tripartite-type tricarboxylate transporter receptor subunit TctC